MEYITKNKTTFVGVMIITVIFFVIIAYGLGKTFSIDSTTCPGNWVYLEETKKCMSYSAYDDGNTTENKAACESAIKSFGLTVDGTNNYCEYNQTGSYIGYINPNVKVRLDANTGSIRNDDTSSTVSYLNVDATYNSTKGKYTYNINLDSKYDIYKSGYKFIGWSSSKGTDGACFPSFHTGDEVIVSDTPLYACWKKESTTEPTEETYKITFNANGGTINGKTSDTCKASSGEECQITNLPTATKSGYTFGGWGNSASCTTGYKSYIYIGSNIEYYACWQKNTTPPTEVTLTLNPNGGKYVSSSSDFSSINGTTATYTKKYNKGSTFSYSSVSAKKEGYTFLGWDTNSSCTNPKVSGSITLNSDVSLKACFEGDIVVTEPLTYYTILFNADGGKFANGTSSRTVIINNEATVQEIGYNPVKEGYKFVGWYDTKNNLFTFGNTVTSDIELIAKWELDDTEKEYKCEGNDPYDPTTGKCISIQEFNGDKILVTEKSYIKSCVNNLTVLEYQSCDGSCDENQCSVGYTKSYWNTENSCYIGSQCSTTSTSSCSSITEGECYRLYEPEEVSIENNDDDEIENVQTSDIPIYIVWIVGLGALGYSVYYIRKNKENI